VGPDKQKDRGWVIFLSWNIYFLLSDVRVPDSQAFELRLDDATGFPELSSLQMADHGTTLPA
jgi:hypothetical protein